MATGSDFDRNVEYLRDVQYRDSTELTKRANLHVVYRTAPQPTFDWLADRVDWPAGGRVLDVGCGGGFLWEHVAAALPDGLALTLSDLSPGMVDEAVERATATGRFAAVSGEPADARELPFDDDAFDVVVSTYALYHVPEPEVAVAQLARVMRPGGLVVIMTNGPGHLVEIEAIRVDVFGPDAVYDVNRHFSPAVAAGVLVGHFDEVAWHRYDDTLAVTDPDDLIAFVTSTPPATDATSDQLAAVRAAIDDVMAANDGVFRVSKDTGAFLCRRPVTSGVRPQL